MISTRADHISKRRKIKEYYSDFTINMDINENTGSLVRHVNADAVKESIKNLILTNTGERFYHLDVGSVIRKSLFNPIDIVTTEQIRNTITNTIHNYEPRANNVEVKIQPMPEQDAYIVTIAFTVINIPQEVFHVVEILNRVR